MTEARVYTIGRSTPSIAELFGMLRASDVELLIDVRTVAGSRHNPRFGEGELAESLPNAGIG